ncbi:class I SAM-dependent methyltransferase [Sciscionella marina]|uniref:class I SAM-dependent methyltransferase n=1 Tax=Sciscionella marina TaxID=508770 RepID=UPI00035C64DE|nr:class I SAM-dependent methyltransferase [Sciscionella marina]
MAEPTDTPDWQQLLHTWDRQQQGYVAHREQLIGTMLDATEAVVGDAPLALDLACGPGTISARLLERFPKARCVAVDIDPLLLAIGQGALSTMDGRLHWVDADITTDSWLQAIGDEQFDVVLSATALHWLTPAQLITTYRDISAALRPGGLLLNADRLEFDERSPTCRELTATVTKTRWQTAFCAEDIDDWETWWASLAGHPVLEALLETRRERFAGNDGTTTQRRGAITSYALHVAALAEAGFHEIDTIWQDLNRRLLLAIN